MICYTHGILPNQIQQPSWLLIQGWHYQRQLWSLQTGDISSADRLFKWCETNPPKTDKSYKTGHLPLYKAHGFWLRSSQLSQSIDNYLSLSSRGDVWLWVMGIGLGFGHRAPKMAELLSWTIRSYPRSYPEATFVLWKPDFGDLHLPFCAMVNTWDSCPILWDGCPCHGMTRPKSYPILSLIVGHAFPYSSIFLHIPHTFPYK